MCLRPVYIVLKNRPSKIGTWKRCRVKRAACTCLAVERGRDKESDREGREGQRAGEGHEMEVT